MVEKKKYKKYLVLYTFISGFTCVTVFWMVMLFDVIFGGDGTITFNFNKYGERDFELIILSIAMVGFFNIFLDITQSKFVIIYLLILIFIISLLFGRKRKPPVKENVEGERYLGKYKVKKE